MRHAALPSFMQMLRRVAARHARDEQADAELLARFVRQGDEAAFEVLVHRHGPMVWGVCRRLLTRTEDAEDAFQAAFVVLLRRAGSIRDGSLLGNWLYGVAYRVAVRARARAARRAARERQGMLTERAATATETTTDWQHLLHEEVFRLPEKYRLPIVICYLSGKTNEEAAAALGWPVGTVKGRLSRARELLRVRLARRGVCLAGAALTGTLSAARLDAALPPSLMQSTVTGAVTGMTAGISPHALTLSKGVMQSMFWNKCATAGMALAALALLPAGTMLSYYGLSAMAQDRAAAGAAAPAAQTPPPKAQPAPKVNTPREIGMSHNSPELVRASVEGDLATVRKLVESGADVNSTDEHGMGPLLTFTPSVTEYLLSKGADPNRQKNESSAPVLVGVAYMNNLECVRLLLEAGADPNAVNECGETALHSSLTHANESVSAADRHAVVQLLIKHGADPNRRTIPGMITQGFWRDTRTRGETPLHRAAAFASEETVKFLLEAGADKTIRDVNGDSPQSWASWHWRPKHLIFLLDPHRTK
jgi:RNA polymerase sigma factor (sigma-70 family)